MDFLWTHCTNKEIVIVHATDQIWALSMPQVKFEHCHWHLNKPRNFLQLHFSVRNPKVHISWWSPVSQIISSSDSVWLKVWHIFCICLNNFHNKNSILNKFSWNTNYIICTYNFQMANKCNNFKWCRVQKCGQITNKYKSQNQRFKVSYHNLPVSIFLFLIFTKPSEKSNKSQRMNQIWFWNTHDESKFFGCTQKQLLMKLQII